MTYEYYPVTCAYLIACPFLSTRGYAYLNAGAFHVTVHILLHVHNGCACVYFIACVFLNITVPIYIFNCMCISYCFAHLITCSYIITCACSRRNACVFLLNVHFLIPMHDCFMTVHFLLLCTSYYILPVPVYTLLPVYSF